MSKTIAWLAVGGLLLATLAVRAQKSDEAVTVQVFMPDGQIRSHSVRVYVSGQHITAGQQPQLRLLRSHAVTPKALDESKRFDPGVVAPQQEWTEHVGGQAVSRTGTLLLFDLGAMDFQFKAMVRVLPVVTWADENGDRIAVGSSEVNLGSMPAAISWTSLTVIATLLLIVLLSRRTHGSPIGFLTGADGHLSLAHTQIACWTVVVAGIVLGYGMIRFDVPEIPAALVVLMAASLVTGGVGSLRDTQKRDAATLRAQGAALPKQSPKLSDLICVFSPDDPRQPPELSLAKAQMLFWTVVLLLLFVSKSILDGAIWDLPWPLVALMGFSQAGYLAPKLVPAPPAPPPP